MIPQASTSPVRVARGCQSKATKSKYTQTTLPATFISAIFYTLRCQTYSFPTFPCVTELHRLQDVSYLFIRCHTMALEQVDVITGTQRVILRYGTINHSARFFQVRYCNLSPLAVLLYSSHLYFPPILQIPPLARHPFTANHPHICVSLYSGRARHSPAYLHFKACLGFRYPIVGLELCYRVGFLRRVGEVVET